MFGYFVPGISFLSRGNKTTHILSLGIKLQINYNCYITKENPRAGQRTTQLEEEQAIVVIFLLLW